MLPQSDSIMIGGLFSQSGVTALVERVQRLAFLLAVEEINEIGGILGRPIAVIDGELGSSLSGFVAEAERLIAQGAKTLFGCYMSSTRRAVLPVIERNDALLFYPTFYEGFEFSEHCVYSGATPSQNSVWLADYLAQNVGKRFYFAGSNYVFPYESNRIMRDLLQNRGCEVVEERYIPLDASSEDIDRIISDIQRYRKPLVVFLSVVGDAAPKFYQAYHAAGFDPVTQPIASITLGEPEIAMIGAEAAAGHIVAAPYFASIETARNKQFVQKLRSRFNSNVPISACAEAAYFQVHLFAQAARHAQAVDRKSVLQALPSVDFEAPQGNVRIDQMTHHTYLTPRIGKVRFDGTFEIISSELAPVRPDPYMINYEGAVWGKSAYD
ncbi:MAG: branched-chain amino acid transport system substrate-binding protein [Litorivivens sp.]|jgi:branched-chain amino acid transport system substrate-binding protein